MSDAAGALEHAFAGLVDAVAGVAPGWLALGVVLHLANQVARGRGWYAVIRTAGGETARSVTRSPRGSPAPGPEASSPPAAVTRCACSCSPGARPATGCALLTGTLVAEAVGECALGAAVLALALAIGVGPEVGPSATSALYVSAGVLALTAFVLLGRRSSRVRGFLSRAKQGCVALKCPKSYARDVLPWQLR